MNILKPLTTLFVSMFMAGCSDQPAIAVTPGITHTVTCPDAKDDSEELRAVIFPNKKYGRITRYFFYDLKGAPGSLNNAANAKLCFGTEQMNGIRLPIYGDRVTGGHTAPGVIGDKVYEKVLLSVENARKFASGELIFMASKKLEGKTSFPEWVMTTDGIDPEKYAVMLMDYISFMKDKGITIDVLGIDNEANFNEGNITPEKYMRTVDIVRSECARRGYKVPLIIGHERFNPQPAFATCWLKNLYDNNWQDRLDIYGTHYYPEHHNVRMYNALKKEYNLTNSDREREFWATEPHWNNNAEAQNDMLYHSEQAICTLWDQTDLGMDTFIWWGYPLKIFDLRSALIHDLSLTIYGARPVEMEDHDGTDTMERGKLQTRAFIKGNEVHVYAINVVAKNEESTGKNYVNYNFSVKDAKIDGNVNILQWSDYSTYSGSRSEIPVKRKNSFSVSLPERSITHISFRIK